MKQWIFVVSSQWVRDRRLSGNIKLALHQPDCAIQITLVNYCAQEMPRKPSKLTRPDISGVKSNESIRFMEHSLNFIRLPGEKDYSKQKHNRSCWLSHIRIYSYSEFNKCHRPIKTYIMELHSVSVLNIFQLRLAIIMFVFVARAPRGVMASSFTRFLDHTQRRTTVGWTPLDKWSARRRDLYLTTNNTHNRQSPMHPLPVGFEPTILAGERP